MIVMKFGGTSVGTASAMKKVAEIIQAEPESKKVIVLSACSGITNSLIHLANQSAIVNESKRKELIEEIMEFHYEIIISLGMSPNDIQVSIQSIHNEIHEFCEGISLLGECTPRSIDRMCSFGELLSTQILSHYLKECGLNNMWLQAAHFIKTDSTYTSATVDMLLMTKTIQEKLIPQFEVVDTIITQGFIGSDKNGIITTLGRGGSDYTAALIGMAIKAQKIIIWTDVSGIASADPNIIPNAKIIETMSFEEARMLSFFGAKVLHPDTIFPAVINNIPVIVKNTFSPSDPGTTIIANNKYVGKDIVSITCKDSIGYVLFASKGDVSMCQKIAEIGLFLDSLACNVYAFGAIENQVYAIVSLGRTELLSKAETLIDWDVVYREKSLIAGIGPNLFAKESNGSLSVFNTIICAHDEYPILLSGVSQYSYCAVVKKSALNDMLSDLHKAFIEL